jgi:hypothetical protein
MAPAAPGGQVEAERYDEREDSLHGVGRQDRLEREQLEHGPSAC